MLEKLKPQQTKHIVQVIIGVFAIFLFYELRIFIDAFLSAVILYVLFRPLMDFLIKKWKWKKWVSAIAVIVATLFLIVIPLITIASYIIPKFINIVTDSSIIGQVVDLIDQRMRVTLGVRLFSPENLQNFSQKATLMVTGLVGTTFSILGDVIIMYFLLYFLLISSGSIQQIVEDYVPFSHENILRFSRELQGMTYANALGAPLIAVLQAAAASIGFYLFDVSAPIFWGIMCGLSSFIPAIGTGLIWIPAVIIKFIEGHTGQGAGLLLYSAAFIVAAENFLRIALQKKMADVHPIITILGFIIGIELFGLPGIIFGPLLLSWFLLLLEIYRDEFISTTAPLKKKSE